MSFRPCVDVPGIDVWRPGVPLRILIAEPAAPPFYPAEEERRWSDLCVVNPRVHDAPILAVNAIDPARGALLTRRDRYKRLALQECPAPSPDSVWMLGVKGWITARDRSGAEHLLIARRGSQTRIYAGLWESAPAGGVDPPADSVTELAAADLARTLRVEANEELGMDLDTSTAAVIGVCRDYIAGSDDIFIGVELKSLIDPRHAPRCEHATCGWEYTDAAWLSRADARAFDARASNPIVPPTRAILRMLGWI